MMKKLTGKQLAWLMTLVYFSSYVTRINLGAILQEVLTDTGFLKTELSIVLVGMSITYGIGQLVTGALGDHVPPQYLIGGGMVVASAINFVFPFVCTSRILMCILWSLNGFCHAMLWPPMTKIMATALSRADYEYGVIRASWGSSFGTIAVYLLAPLVLQFSGWKTVFWICSGIGALAAATWLLLQRRIDYNGGAKEQGATVSSPLPEKQQIGRRFVLPLAIIMFSIALQGMIRDGVTNWMPTYLSEIFHMSSSASILSTVTLAVFGILSFWIVGAIYTRFFTNETSCAALMFGVCAAAALVFYFLHDAGAIYAILLMSLMVAAMHGVNLVLIGYIPKRFYKIGRVSTVSGMINSCTYVGASISTYVVAKIAESAGWRFNIFVWFIVAFLGFLSCILVRGRWKKVLREEHLEEGESE